MLGLLHQHLNVEHLVCGAMSFLNSACHLALRFLCSAEADALVVTTAVHTAWQEL